MKKCFRYELIFACFFIISTQNACRTSKSSGLKDVSRTEDDEKPGVYLEPVPHGPPSLLVRLTTSEYTSLLKAFNIEIPAGSALDEAGPQGIIKSLFVSDSTDFRCFFNSRRNMDCQLYLATELVTPTKVNSVGEPVAAKEIKDSDQVISDENFSEWLEITYAPKKSAELWERLSGLEPIENPGIGLAKKINFAVGDVNPGLKIECHQAKATRDYDNTRCRLWLDISKKVR